MVPYTERVAVHNTYIAHYNITSLHHNNNMNKTFQLFLPPRTEPASLEKNPVTPARGPPD